MITPRDRASLPRLGTSFPTGAVLLDTNVFINALAGRGPPELGALLANLPLAFVSGPTVAEMSWTRGRLDPAHPDTARVLDRYRDLLARVDPGKILVPTAAEWAEAGELAGRTARAIAGPIRSVKTAFDRVELVNDAVTAVVAMAARVTVVTQDGDFDVFQQLRPEMDVLFYD